MLTITAHPESAGRNATNPTVVVVIPCYRVVRHVLEVISAIGSEVAHIICVDDCCPESSGDFIAHNCSDPRVRVIYNEINLGVGGAVMAGYRESLAIGADIVVKVDGDGQMNPGLIPDLISPLLNQQADYVKGNRFYHPEDVAEMPLIRLIGNAGLSFCSKFSSGYWNIFDPTNGFTAIHVAALRHLPLAKISHNYFFESDMLFRLSTIRAVVVDMPMRSIYGDEESNLKVSKILFPFLLGHWINLTKRIFYQYFMRDFNVASIELILGIIMLAFSIAFGSVHWMQSAISGVPATPGTVMVAALPALAGVQLLLGFLNFDYTSVPTRPLCRQKW